MFCGIDAHKRFHVAAWLTSGRRAARSALVHE